MLCSIWVRARRSGRARRSRGCARGGFYAQLTTSRSALREAATSPDIQLLQALAVQCAARARGDTRNAPVKAKLLLRQLRQPLDLMRAAAERLNELGGAHGDPEPCADGSTHRREARADERDAPGDASLVERCNSRPADGYALKRDRCSSP